MMSTLLWFSVLASLALFQGILSQYFKKDVLFRIPDISKRIYNGDDAQPGDLPYQVSLQVLSGQHFCGGSIISNNWIVTAAHCVVPEITGIYDQRRIKVVAGITDRSDNSSPGKQEASISNIIVHPNFQFELGKATNTSDKIENDIAIIRLANDLEFTKFVSPIHLPERGQDFRGTHCVASGWGLTDWSLHESPKKLQRAELNLLPDTICSYDPSFDPVTQLCTFELETVKLLCKGDSGGPLACDLNGVRYLAGVASLSGDCNELSSGNGGPLSIFTRVDYYAEWINSETQG